MRRILLTTAGVLLCLGGALLAAAPQQPRAPAAIAPVAQIHPPAPEYQFPNGQVFVFEAEWRLWTAGTARLEMAPSGVNDQRVNGSADASGVVALLYPVHDRFQAIFDRRTFCSLNLTKHTEEGFHKRETLISFNYGRHVSILDETNLKSGQAKHVEHEIPGCVTDVLSGIFYVASLPLTPNSTYTFPLNDGGDTVNVTARVEGRESVKTPAGTFNTVRVAPEASTGVLKERGRVWIWYTDDARHLPVQMRARMFWGTLTFRLLRIETK
jgi:Protein of unknown function (DUF3108)